MNHHALVARSAGAGLPPWLGSPPRPIPTMQRRHGIAHDDNCRLPGAASAGSQAGCAPALRRPPGARSGLVEGPNLHQAASSPNGARARTHGGNGVSSPR
jgi:hypothetical protein